MPKFLEVNLSNYYKSKLSSANSRVLLKGQIKVLIIDFYFEFKQRYGSPRIAMEMRQRGYKFSPITAVKFMKEMGDDQEI